MARRIFCFLMILAVVESTLAMESSNKFDNGYPEVRYHQVLDHFYEIFAPQIAAEGGEFLILRDWSDGAVNMWAEKWGPQYRLEIPGGMARYHLIVEEAFLLSACHELGHLLGGPPQSGEISFEGQSDYYATQDCIKPVLEDLSGFKSLIYDLDVIGECSAEPDEVRSLCERVLQGAKSLSSYYAELEGSEFPQLDSPSGQKVSKTLSRHPPAQCRLDTFKAGYFNESRPACWFNPD